jgi:hypothetical protein
MWNYESLESEGLQGIASRSCLLGFEGIGQHETVYNPCPFVIDNEVRLLGRVEAHDSEISHVHEFKKEGGKWRSQELAFLHVQDPFITCIKGRTIVGGVALDFSEPLPGVYKIENYRTSFFDFKTKQKITDGPDEMKDIRLVDLGDSVGVFARPRSEHEGIVHSSIQFSTVPSVEAVTPDFIGQISGDPLKKVEGFFNHNEWGGVNAVYKLTGGWLGVLGHIAYYSTEHLRKYAAIAFEFNPVTKEVTQPVMILARNNLSMEAKPKFHDLHDVIFPGGFIFLRSEKAAAKADSSIENILFFYGLGDAHVGVSELPFPFHHSLDQSSSDNNLFIIDRSTGLSTVGLPK